MKYSTKQTIGAWMLIAVFTFAGIGIGYMIGNDPELDELEEKIRTLQLQSETIQGECIDELERMHRVISREINLFQEPLPTNGK